MVVHSLKEHWHYKGNLQSKLLCRELKIDKISFWFSSEKFKNEINLQQEMDLTCTKDNHKIKNEDFIMKAKICNILQSFVISNSRLNSLIFFPMEMCVLDNNPV